MATSIHQFSDYRVFLSAHAQERRARNSRWSFGTWSKQLGLKDTSSLTKVVNGDRHPGPQIRSAMVRYFGFDKEEAAYFLGLVEFDRVKRDPRASAKVLDRLEFIRKKGAVRTLDDQVFSLLSKWYCLAVREMTQLDRFREDPAWIAKEFKFEVKPSEVRSALELLESLKLIVRDGAGKFRPHEVSLDTGSDLASEAVRRFHHQMLERAALALESSDIKEREFLSTCLVVSRKKLPEMKTFCREFHREFIHRFEETGGDELYQVQAQLFPVTKKKEG